MQKMYSAEWERSREDSNCILEDGSEILGYKIKLEKNMLMKNSASKDDDTDSIREIVRSIID